MSAGFRNPIVAEAYSIHRDRIDNPFIDTLSAILSRCDGSVVDIGAGVGGTSHALRIDGHDVIPVEPSAAMVNQGRMKYPTMRWVRAPGEDLPLPDNSAGSALLAYVIHHADDPVKMLSEAARVVGPNGQVVIVTPRRDSARQQLFRSYFPTLAPEAAGADDVWWWGCDAGLEAAECITTTHWVYPHRTLDEDYLRLAECELFSALREIDEVEFESGLRKMRADLGRTLPAPEVDIVVMRPADVSELAGADEPWISGVLDEIRAEALIAF